MILRIMLLEDPDDPEIYGVQEKEYFLPLSHVDTYGRYSESGVGYHHTEVNTKTGLVYRLNMDVQQFHAIYSRWHQNSYYIFPN